MIFESLALLTVGADFLLGNRQERKHIEKWIQETHLQWCNQEGMFADCITKSPPPPIQDPWWKNSIRPRSGGTTYVLDYGHLRQCVYKYDDEWRRLNHVR